MRFVPCGSWESEEFWDGWVGAKKEWDETYCDGVATRAVVAVVVLTNTGTGGVSVIVDMHCVAREVSCEKRYAWRAGARRGTYWRYHLIWVWTCGDRGRDPGRVSGEFCGFVCWKARGGERRMRCLQRRSLRRGVVLNVCEFCGGYGGKGGVPSGRREAWREGSVSEPLRCCCR